MTAILEDNVFDFNACHHEGAYWLWVIAEDGTICCGHCLEPFALDRLHHALIRCDGTVVRVTQADFGLIHECGQDTTEAELAQILDVATLADTPAGA